MTQKKIKKFTLQEADALLPELEKRLKHLQNKKEAYARTHDSLFMHELVCAAERSNGLSEEKDDLEAGIHALEDAIEGLAGDVEAIFALGCVLRNIERGHVEFYGAHDGEEVYFSWKLGEPSVGHYRPVGKKAHERVAIHPKRPGSKKS